MEEIVVIEDLALISVVGGPHKELIGLSGKVLSILNKLEIRTSSLITRSTGVESNHRCTE